MPFEGMFQGPPEDDHPEQLGMQISSPSRRASAAACLNMSNHSGELKSSGPGGMLQPASNICTPPMPAFASASKSQVMPSFVTLPFIMWYHVCGFAELGGLRKPSSSVMADEQAHATIPAKQIQPAFMELLRVVVMEKKRAAGIDPSPVEGH